MEKIAIITDQIFTQYLYFLNIPVVLYVYSNSPNKSYIYDVIGILVLSLASYEFHKAVANIYKRLNVVVYTSDDIIEFYSADQISIHLRAFLGTVTALYYSNFNIFLIPAVYHSGSCIATLNYLYNLKLKYWLGVNHFNQILSEKSLGQKIKCTTTSLWSMSKEII